MNNLKIDITNKYVVLQEGTFKPEYDTIEYRVFHAKGGFGCSPTTTGTAVFGVTPYDGEEFRTEGFYIERLATEDEIAMVTGKSA